MQEKLNSRNKSFFEKTDNKVNLVFINKPWIFSALPIFILLVFLLLTAVINGKCLAVIVMLIAIKIWLKIFPLSYSFYNDRIVIRRFLHSDKVIYKEGMARIIEMPYVLGMYFGSGPILKLKNGKVVPIGSGIKWDQPKLVMKIASIYEIEYTLIKEQVNKS